jgi:hypothetical protein
MPADRRRGKCRPIGYRARNGAGHGSPSGVRVRRWPRSAGTLPPSASGADNHATTPGPRMQLLGLRVWRRRRRLPRLERASGAQDARRSHDLAHPPVRAHAQRAHDFVRLLGCATGDDHAPTGSGRIPPRLEPASLLDQLVARVRPQAEHLAGQVLGQADDLNAGQSANGPSGSSRSARPRASRTTSWAGPTSN